MEFEAKQQSSYLTVGINSSGPNALKDLTQRKQLLFGNRQLESFSKANDIVEIEREQSEEYN